MIKEFIKSNFQKALRIQNDFDHDEQMINAIKEKSLNNNMVKKWMINYGLFQGIKNEIRDKVASEFIEFAYLNNDANTLEIESKFQELHTKLFKIKNRKWISAVSKLLWCMDPENVIIYDAFVERSITILQCIDSELAKFPRINYTPDAKKDTNSKLMTIHYMNYQNLVKSILDRNKVLIQQLQNKYPSNYKYEVRIIDKLLWIMGDLKSEFELNGISCRPKKSK